MDVIKIIAEDNEQKTGLRYSEKYWGIISADQAADLNQHVEELRNEWERDI